MNLAHRWLCNSGHWRSTVEKRILPWTLEGVELGKDVLEIGPGPGVTTESLRRRVPDLTCIEIDGMYASSLARRIGGNSVRVLCGDATAMPLPDANFDAVVCFSMLHHVSSIALQDRLLAEAARVLRPGGIFAGVDSLSSRLFRLFHLFDTMVVIDPGTFPNRLEAAGFENIQVDVIPRTFRFRARKPA
ncbi:MAG: class I SAM-dependent methyltransferase [Acidobacteriaceae bacterium]|nr:class I SAM-dependent methyltransferase [Acidobacteriaceae bacterium]